MNIKAAGEWEYMQSFNQFPQGVMLKNKNNLAFNL
jgi:hypothetical protein